MNNEVKKMYDSEYIRQRMKEFRIQKNLKQKDVAEEMGISAAFYSMLESGKKKVTVDHLFRFSYVVGVPMFVIMGKEENGGLLCDYSELDELDKAIIELLLEMSQDEKKTLLKELQRNRLPVEMLVETPKKKRTPKKE